MAVTSATSQVTPTVSLRPSRLAPTVYVMMKAEV
jgi:hypothetical protein